MTPYNAGGIGALMTPYNAGARNPSPHEAHTHPHSPHEAHAHPHSPHEAHAHPHSPCAILPAPRVVHHSPGIRHLASFSWAQAPRPHPAPPRSSPCMGHGSPCILNTHACAPHRALETSPATILQPGSKDRMPVVPRATSAAAGEFSSMLVMLASAAQCAPIRRA